MEILQLKNIGLKLGEKQVLNGLTLSVKSGSIHSILGINAAGKSSLAFLIMGCAGYQPQSGQIFFKNEDITRLAIHQRAQKGLTLAWQEPARFEGLTVQDYIAAGMKEKNHRSIEEALAMVLLDPPAYLQRLVDKTLSGGERKRIELAAVYAMHPELVVLDEPDSGIDILALDNIIALIKGLKKQGTTVILITHREEVSEIADVTSLMCSGCIVQEGKPREVGRRFKSRCIPCPTKIFPSAGEGKAAMARD
ncbi:MAG TPA: ATP-binding cassette domain-containing protein [Candidatus Omnitrophota bacterium]|nr:ATP-binding cassette domain-containing protein [Candidatus Omnitrophota bacterium]